MRGFFNGWRRKAGCLSLVIACALMGGLIRSRVVQDTVDYFDKTDRRISLTSLKCELMCDVITVEGQVSRPVPLLQRSFSWSVHPLQAQPKSWITLDATQDGAEKTWSCSGIKYDEFNMGQMKFVSWGISYWYFIVPFTLAAAYLILWVPRKRDSLDLENSPRSERLAPQTN
jgi:hypothetical protein